MSKVLGRSCIEDMQQVSEDLFAFAGGRRAKGRCLDGDYHLQSILFPSRSSHSTFSVTHMTEGAALLHGWSCSRQPVDWWSQVRSTQAGSNWALKPATP
jgi:hypothetical protein